MTEAACSPLGPCTTFELDALAFLEVAVALGEDRRVVDEDVFAALTGDEAVALARR